ncbi:NAD(P)-binding protein [Punctularia strigosozonata HHB-11173 SS5]|uniref:NAD(P)-binding protein n=1 Tax=Punctularia strigosozonata (strain HHB-11173) TaxID=741275 RepID=UPI00044181E5|nr:NAD(P)-binding protein [Punctularia strigosozonata HHB-11173 SS5]EIN11559.1 NAD(P)-binding protein [Punctularia strigosozonata HHB-11173 SS5]
MSSLALSRCSARRMISSKILRDNVTRGRTIPVIYRRAISSSTPASSSPTYVDQVQSVKTMDQVPAPKPTPKLSDSVFEMFSMKGKVAVVTGAGTGIGYQICRAYAEAGATVVLGYNSSAKAAEENAATIAKDFGVKTKAIQIPQADAEKVEQAIKSVAQEFGRLDVVVANGGIGGSFDIAGASLEDWRKVNSVNYDGVFYLARVAGTIFKAQGFGNFIATASMSGHIVNIPKNQAAYNAGKAAVIHFCKSLAVEWKDFARVNVVSPGFFDTKMGAGPEVLKTAHEMAVLGRQGDPRELKGIFLYLASDASTFTTGSDIIVDGGYVLP